ncbi:MAG: hypothetical protein U9N14_00830 [Pseudomonadota bacterium]|nr:hypothetical protein [Pseudomonadota bacterium]
MKPLCAVLVLFAFVVLSSQAKAAGCYTIDEIEAEQAVRLHSEMMVLGLTCRAYFPDAYTRYNSFTVRHAVLLGGYEDRLISHFKRVGAANPIRAFHTRRTEIANEISGMAATMTPIAFCGKFGVRIYEMDSLDERGVRRLARTYTSSLAGNYLLCATALR